MYEREHAPLYASVQIGLIQQSSFTILLISSLNSA